MEYQMRREVFSKKKLKVVDSFHFDDEKHGDLFEREPFIVRFNAENAPVKDFFIAGIHTSPESAREEIASLVQAYNDAVKRFKIEVGLYGCLTDHSNRM